MRFPSIPPPDGSRDPRTEDPTNIWFVHLIGRLLLPLMLRLRFSANAVSVAGFLMGAAAARFYFDWREPEHALAGFLLTLGWLIADGLDGMIARARGTASGLGRFLDGLCDHGVFLLLYLSLGASLGTLSGWALAVTAGLVHAVQSTLYEGERSRFHRRIAGDPGARGTPQTANLLVRLYDAVAGSLDRLATPFDRRLSDATDRLGFGRLYGDRAWPPLKLMALLSNNMRVLLIYIACLYGDIRLYWWIELVPLSVVALIGIIWHRRIETDLLRQAA